MTKTWEQIIDIYFNTLVEHDFIDDDKINSDLGNLIECRIYLEIGKKAAKDFTDTITYILRNDDFKAKTEKSKIMYVQNQKDYFKTLI